jgi:hypothetical protein
MLNDWLSFDNDSLQGRLLEAARTRTYDRYSQVLVRSLPKAIRQSPDFNTENFSKTYFDPLRISMHDPLHHHDHLSANTSDFSNNASKTQPITQKSWSSAMLLECEVRSKVIILSNFEYWIPQCKQSIASNRKDILKLDLGNLKSMK